MALPLPIGSDAAEARGANANSASSAAITIPAVSIVPRAILGWDTSVIWFLRFCRPLLCLQATYDNVDLSASLLAGLPTSQPTNRVLFRWTRSTQVHRKLRNRASAKPRRVGSQYPLRRWRASRQLRPPRPTARSLRWSDPTTSASSPTPGSRSSRSTTTSDVAPGLRERLGEPGAPPFTRGIHERMYRDRLWTMRQYAGLRLARGHQRALPLPDRARLDRALDGLRPADPARPRLRRPALQRRGRAHRGPDRHDRGHADLLRPDPARRRLHLDDDQRPGGDPAAALRAGRRGAGRALREAARHGPERRAEGVHGARQLHLPARADDAPDHRHLRVLPRERAEMEHDLDLRVPHPREGLLGRAGGRRSPSPTRSPTSRRRSSGG